MMIVLINISLCISILCSFDSDPTIDFWTSCQLIGTQPNQHWTWMSTGRRVAWAKWTETASQSEEFPSAVYNYRTTPDSVIYADDDNKLHGFICESLS